MSKALKVCLLILLVAGGFIMQSGSDAHRNLELVGGMAVQSQIMSRSTLAYVIEQKSELDVIERMERLRRNSLLFKSTARYFENLGGNLRKVGIQGSVVSRGDEYEIEVLKKIQQNPGPAGHWGRSADGELRYILPLIDENRTLTGAYSLILPGRSLSSADHQRAANQAYADIRSRLMLLMEGGEYSGREYKRVSNFELRDQLLEIENRLRPVANGMNSIFESDLGVGLDGVMAQSAPLYEQIVLVQQAFEKRPRQFRLLIGIWLVAIFLLAVFIPRPQAAPQLEPDNRLWDLLLEIQESVETINYGLHTQSQVCQKDSGLRNESFDEMVSLLNNECADSQTLRKTLNAVQELTNVVQLINAMTLRVKLLAIKGSEEIGLLYQPSKGLVMLVEELKNIARQTVAAAEQITQVIEHAAADAKQGSQLLIDIESSRLQITQMLSGLAEPRTPECQVESCAINSQISEALTNLRQQLEQLESGAVE